MESFLGKGSVFYFTVHFGIPQSEGAAEASPGIELTGMRTLLVSSNDGSRGLVEEALQSWGATISEARDEESALTVLTRVEGGGNPHRLLFLDLGESRCKCFASVFVHENFLYEWDGLSHRWFNGKSARRMTMWFGGRKLFKEEYRY